MAERVTEFDEAEFLTSSEDITGYLNEVLGFGDPETLWHALDVVARARGMARLTRDERFDSVQAAFSSLGLNLTVQPA